MEIFLDNCIATVLFSTDELNLSFHATLDEINCVRAAIIHGLTINGISLVCNPTLLHEFNKNSDGGLKELHPGLMYACRSDPDDTPRSLIEFELVHYKNYEYFLNILEDFEKYVGIEFNLSSHERIQEHLENAHNLYKSHTYEIFNAQGICGRSKILARPAKFNGKLKLNPDYRVLDFISSYSDDNTVQVFITYVLASIYLRFKNDSVFPLCIKEKSGKNGKLKIRDRKVSLISDFLYIFDIMGRKCTFISADRALLFKSSATMRMMDKPDVLILELNIYRYIELQVRLLRRRIRSFSREHFETRNG